MQNKCNDNLNYKKQSMYFVSYTTTRENTKTRLNAENMPKSNAIYNVKLN